LSPPEFHYFPVEKLISQEKTEVKNLEKHIKIKFQITNSKIPNKKYEDSGFSHWCLELIWDLVL